MSHPYQHLPIPTSPVHFASHQSGPSRGRRSSSTSTGHRGESLPTHAVPYVPLSSQMGKPHAHTMLGFPSTSPTPSDGGLHHQNPQVVTPAVPLMNHGTLSKILLMPESQYQARHNHSQRVDRSQDESVNPINIGHGPLELGAVNAPEGAVNLVSGLTETPESPHPPTPTIPPTDLPHCDVNPLSQLLACAPTTERRRKGPALRVTLKKCPRSREADACEDPQVETAPGKRPTKVRKLEAGRADQRRETDATKVLKEWREITKRKGKDHVNFDPDGFIQSQEEYKYISSKLLRCLEKNCTSEWRFTRFCHLKYHVIQLHFLKQVAMRDGETTDSPSYQDRIAAAHKEGEAKVSGEDYVALMEGYRSLGRMVGRN